MRRGEVAAAASEIAGYEPEGDRHRPGPFEDGRELARSPSSGERARTATPRSASRARSAARQGSTPRPRAERLVERAAMRQVRDRRAAHLETREHVAQDPPRDRHARSAPATRDRRGGSAPCSSRVALLAMASSASPSRSRSRPNRARMKSKKLPRSPRKCSLRPAIRCSSRRRRNGSPGASGGLGCASQENSAEGLDVSPLRRRLLTESPERSELEHGRDRLPAVFGIVPTDLRRRRAQARPGRAVGGHRRGCGGDQEVVRELREESCSARPPARRAPPGRGRLAGSEGRPGVLRWRARRRLPAPRRPSAPKSASRSRRSRSGPVPRRTTRGR